MARRMNVSEALEFFYQLREDESADDSSKSSTSSADEEEDPLFFPGPEENDGEDSVTETQTFKTSTKEASFGE